MSTSPNRVSPLVLAPLAALLPLLLVSSGAARPSASAPRPSSAPSTHAAAPWTLAQYRERVRGGAAALEELAAFCEELSKGEKPEVWSKEGFDPDVALQLPKMERTTFERVRALLPPGQKVEWTGGAIEVDNSWLGAALEEYGRAS